MSEYGSDMPDVFPAFDSWKSTSKYHSLVTLLDKCDSVQELLEYLKIELASDYNSNQLGKAFKENNIDGNAFQHLNDSHLLSMNISPKLKLGQRLRLLSKTQKVARAARVKKRQEVIFQHKKVEVRPPGLEGSVVLTDSYLKFTYEKLYTEPVEVVDVGCCCLMKKKCVIEKSKARFLDHVDISLIDDVQLEKAIETTTITQPSCCWGKCCVSKPEEKKIEASVVYISLNLRSDVGMFIAGVDDTETSVLALKFPNDANDEKAKEFLEKLRNLVTEDHFKIRRFSDRRRFETMA